MKKPFIARDTHEPLRVLGCYDVAEDGSIIHETLPPISGDFGSDPLGNGMHRMVPSGDIVTTEELGRRREQREEPRQ
jgi:hypothetical protein